MYETTNQYTSNILHDLPKVYITNSPPGCSGCSSIYPIMALVAGAHHSLPKLQEYCSHGDAIVLFIEMTKYLNTTKKLSGLFFLKKTHLISDIFIGDRFWEAEHLKYLNVYTYICIYCT